jgi:hypothetical protein
MAALQLLLRLAGVIMSSAFLAMFLPTDWMESTHQWLGLGEFPRSPLVDYLTRSVAALYGFHGALLLLISRDPVKYRTIVQFVAVMNIVFGTIMLVIDLHAGLPWWWTLGEGPPIIAFGIVIAFLNRSVTR